MANKAAPENAQLDVAEIVSTVEAASGLLSHASESFIKVAITLKAITAASASNSLVGRLSRLGESLCDEFVGDFAQYGRDFDELTHRFMTEVAAHEEIRNGC